MPPRCCFARVRSHCSLPPGRTRLLRNSCSTAKQFPPDIFLVISRQREALAEALPVSFFSEGHGFSRAIQSLHINAPLGAEASSLAPQCLFQHPL
jgi:hypothetical protein